MTRAADNMASPDGERRPGASEPRIVSAEPHAMQSSCALTRLELANGEQSGQTILLKDLNMQARHPVPPFMQDDLREITTYETVLRWAELGTPAFVGADRGKRWLMLEEVDGAPLWQTDDQDAWSAAAIWIARLHDLTPVPDGDPFLYYDGAYFGRWMERALRFSPQAGLEALRAAHTVALTRLAAAATGPLHGDYYPANILVRSLSSADICPVDFEFFGVGPGVLDLAALITGLPGSQADALVGAYMSARVVSPEREELDELLLCARLHLAIRWLGWLQDWAPPAHQRFDWAAEAHAAARELEAIA